ncbi:MAG: hypothetical protein RR614_09945 [Eubacterium sp.]
MAYKQNKLKNQLQVVLNYGEVEGKTKRRTKTYTDVNLDETVATPEALVETGKAMGLLMTPMIEGCNNVMTYVNIETV